MNWTARDRWTVRAAKRLENEVADGRSVLHHPKDTHIRSGNQPHFQTAGLSGHTFYKALSMGAATTYLGDNVLGNVVDFFNPLSLPKDMADLFDELQSALASNKALDACGCPR